MIDKIYFSMDKYIALQKKDRARDKRVIQKPENLNQAFKKPQKRG